MGLPVRRRFDPAAPGGAGHQHGGIRFRPALTGFPGMRGSAGHGPPPRLSAQARIGWIIKQWGIPTEKENIVYHYVRCRRCGALYFMGACIRGTPVFRQVEKIQKENLAPVRGPVFCRRNAETGVYANSAKHSQKVLKSTTRFLGPYTENPGNRWLPGFWYMLTQKIFPTVASHPGIAVHLNHTDLRKRSDSEL